MVGTEENVSPVLVPTILRDGTAAEGMMTDLEKNDVVKEKSQHSPTLLEGKMQERNDGAVEDPIQDNELLQPAPGEEERVMPEEEGMPVDDAVSSNLPPSSPPSSPLDNTASTTALEARAEGQGESSAEKEGHMENMHQGGTSPVEENMPSTAGPAASSPPESTPEVMDSLEKGEEVSTTWGLGVITDIRAGSTPPAKGHGETYVVKALTWRMADGKAPTMFLQRAYIEKLTPYVLYKWPTHKKLARAVFCKEEGNRSFKAKDLVKAEARYLETIGVVQLMTDSELDNKEKARKLEVLLPTLNNLAAARLKRAKDTEACVVARSAYHLIDELEKRGPSSAVLQELLALGLTEEQLFRRYKRKAAFFAGKALVNLQEWAAALSLLESARAVDMLLDPAGKTLESREAASLLLRARQGKVKQDKKEKAVWSKAFQLSSEATAEEDREAQPSPPTAATGGTGLPASSLFSSLPASLTGATSGAGASGGGKARAVEGGRRKGKKGRKEGGKEGGKEGWWNEKTEMYTLITLGMAVLGGFAFFSYRNKHK